MKATFRNCLAKPSILLAAAALPSFYSALAQAQVPPPAPAAAPVAEPPAAPPVAPPTAAVAPAVAPAVVNPPAPMTPPAPPTVPPPTDAAPPPPPPPPMPEEEKYKHINMGVWMRIAGVLQNQRHAEKMDRASTNGEVELHFSNQMRKYFEWTANIVASYGPTGNGSASSDGSGSFQIMDLIAQLEPDPAFNVWGGRMLVASDRSNFSGPYFMGPWNYPGAYNSGPVEGSYGRNDGVTVWGQAAGGVFKYYLGAYQLYGGSKPVVQPLISGRLNLALLSPEPGYYSSSTYYGKDILSLGVGGQYQKVETAPNSSVYTNYSLFNADLLFEKDLMGSGVFDLEGAFFSYTGDTQDKKISYFGLASYLTPDIGIGKLQPLVRIQQSTPKASGAKTGTAIDAQLGYVLDGYATRFALGYQHVSATDTIGGGTPESQQVYLGIQFQK